MTNTVVAPTTYPLVSVLAAPYAADTPFATTLVSNVVPGPSSAIAAAVVYNFVLLAG